MPMGQGPRKPAGQFEGLEAARLYCSHCKKATAVRSKLLLVLPTGDKYAYFCSQCGQEVGSKLEQGNPDNPWTVR